MAWTTASDVIGSWIGDGAPTDPALVDVWIGRAERLIRRNVPDLQSRLDAEADMVPPVTDLLDLVRDVVIEMVTRVFRNPERIRSTNVTTGPFSENRTYGGDAPGGLSLTADELSSLTVGRAGAFMIDMIPSASPYSPYFVDPLL